MNNLVTNPPRLKSLSMMAGMSAAALIVYLVIVGGNVEVTQIPTVTSSNFKFDVYCPVDTADSINYFKQFYGTTLGIGPSPNLYIVYIQVQNLTTQSYDVEAGTYTTQTKAGLYYCGLAR